MQPMKIPARRSRRPWHSYSGDMIEATTGQPVSLMKGILSLVLLHPCVQETCTAWVPLLFHWLRPLSSAIIRLFVRNAAVFSVWQVDRLDVGANVTTQNGCYTAFHAGSSRLIVNYDPEILSHVPDLGSKYVNIISLLAGHWMPLVCFSKTGKVTAPAPRRPLSSYQTLPMSPQDGGGRNLEGRKPPMIFYDTPLSLRMFSVW